MGSEIRVPDTDVKALRQRLKPGLIMPFALIYQQYELMMRAENRQAASKEALGRALTRADWEARRVRKSRGKRGQQVVTETHCRVVPGAPAVSEEDVRMGLLIASLLDGREHAMIAKHLVWPRYQTLARQHGWPLTLDDEKEMRRWLSDSGVAAMPHGGKRGKGGRPGTPSYYFHRSMIK